MNRDIMDRSGLIATLGMIDEEVLLTYGVPHSRYRAVVVGGCAYMLAELTRRPVTYDIDVLEADEQVRAVMARYHTVNGAVSAHMDEIPYNFEDRLVKLELPTLAVEFKRPSLEDLTVMKLYASRPNDIVDITSPEVLAQLDWDLLEHLVLDEDEAKASVLVPRRYREMVSAYERFVEEYRG